MDESEIVVVSGVLDDREDDSAQLLGDVIHHTSHVANPEWDHVHDSEPEIALRTRLAVLEEFVDAPACASHISGWGSIQREGDGLVWAPL